jgi:hypothetical protein
MSTLSHGKCLPGALAGAFTASTGSNGDGGCPNLMAVEPSVEINACNELSKYAERFYVCNEGERACCNGEKCVTESTSFFGDDDANDQCSDMSHRDGHIDGLLKFECVQRPTLDTSSPAVLGPSSSPECSRLKELVDQLEVINAENLATLNETAIFAMSSIAFVALILAIYANYRAVQQRESRKEEATKKAQAKLKTYKDEQRTMKEDNERIRQAASREKVLMESRNRLERLVKSMKMKYVHFGFSPLSILKFKLTPARL